MKKFSLSFCFLILFGLLAIFNCNYSQEVFADNLQGDGSLASPYIISSVEDFNYVASQINAGNSNYITANYKLINELNFNNTTFQGLGNETNKFQGVFDGGGNTLKNVKINVDASTSADYGIFNYTYNATIKNLAVEIEYIFESEDTNNSNINIGGIVGNGINTTITNCKVVNSLYAFDNETQTKTKANVYSNLTFGGIVGTSEGISVHDCYALVEFSCEQYGNSLISSCFGGIVGRANGGEIYNVYVAPTQQTISSLTGVIADKENMYLYINNASFANVYFGGIAGYVSGRNFTMFNTLFIGYLKANNSVAYGGLIGKLHSSETLMPLSANITQSKYLRINNANTVSFDVPIANASEVNFTPHSTLVQITTFPTNYVYFKDASNGWDELKCWDFSDVWKESTIFNGAGIFLPDLQQFSELYFYLDYQNYSNYYTLNFVGENSNITSKQFKIGDVVEIEASFNGDYANFYDFVNWQKVGDDSFSADGKIKLSLVCSNQTAGSYYLTILGKNVNVNVNIVNENGEVGAFGSVKQNNNTYLENFAFVARYADETTVLKLEAIDTLEEYKFSHFASGDNVNYQNKSFLFKLNNNRDNLPKVEVVDGNLVCTINAVFTNNTSNLKISTTANGGTIKIDGENSITGNINKILVNSKDYTLIATPSEGYIFEGWYLNGAKVETENTYTLNIKQNANLEAKFVKIDEEKSGVNIWLIIGPIIGVLVLGGVITLIVVKVKKNNSNSYKRNFRY